MSGSVSVIVIVPPDYCDLELTNEIYTYKLANTDKSKDPNLLLREFKKLYDSSGFTHENINMIADYIIIHELFEKATLQGDNSIVIQYIDGENGSRFHHTTGILKGKDSVERGKNCIEIFREGARNK